MATNVQSFETGKKKRDAHQGKKKYRKEDNKGDGVGGIVGKDLQKVKQLREFMAKQQVEAEQESKKTQTKQVQSGSQQSEKTSLVSNASKVKVYQYSKSTSNKIGSNNTRTPNNNENSSINSTPKNENTNKKSSAKVGRNDARPLNKAENNDSRKKINPPQRTKKKEEVRQKQKDPQHSNRQGKNNASVEQQVSDNKKSSSGPKSLNSEIPSHEDPIQQYLKKHSFQNKRHHHVQSENKSYKTVQASKDKRERDKNLDFVKNFFENDPDINNPRTKTEEKLPNSTYQASSISFVKNTFEVGLIQRHQYSTNPENFYPNMGHLEEQQFKQNNPFHTLQEGVMQQNFIQNQYQFHSSIPPNPMQSTHVPPNLSNQFPNSQMNHFSNTQHLNQQNKQIFNVSSNSQFSKISDHSSANQHMLNAVNSHFPNPSDSQVQLKTWQERTLKACTIDSKQARYLVEQLICGIYECMVCCEPVRYNHSVWSCSLCYHIFHLKCIKTWAKSDLTGSKDKSGWRCPGCQNLSKTQPNLYLCFCGKIENPDWTPKIGVTPHSCGEVCAKQRPLCRHTCSELCHPGPCPSCPTNINKSCCCGKTSVKRSCGLKDVLTCGKVCSKRLLCGLHYCSLKCHDGPCEVCEIAIIKECYCSKEKIRVVCGNGTVIENVSLDNKEPTYKSFQCKGICNRILDCGNHRCGELCHQGDCQKCVLQPGKMLFCPCGKIKVSVLLNNEPRKSCLDPVPTCGNFCGKALPCGRKDAQHLCLKECHVGSCPKCGKITEVKCRCGLMKKDIPCAELKPEPLLCERKCNKKKRCGRHKCNQKCCDDKDHNCTAICGKKLSCGRHKCEEYCHTGYCPTCWRAGFDELSCQCGFTVLFPPIPCGAKPPECTQPCSRPHACGHPAQHTCHNEENCPPCPVLMNKVCMGGHQLRKNVPCHLIDVSCGQRCNKPLSNCRHTCAKPCHKDPCLGENEQCRQHCLAKRLFCGHPCNAPCHIGFECPKLPCKVEITLSCRCGKRCAKVMCSSGNSGNYQSLNADMLSLSLKNYQSGNGIDVSTLNHPSIQERFLECDAECSRFERNQKLAEAFGIMDEKTTNIFSEFLLEEARLHLTFIKKIEITFESIIGEAKQKQQPVHHSFAPMNVTHRKVVHELAEFYGMKTYSVDQEPKRSIVVIATKESFMPITKLSIITEMNAKGAKGRVKTKALQSMLQLPNPTKEDSKVDYFNDDNIAD